MYCCDIVCHGLDFHHPLRSSLNHHLQYSQSPASLNSGYLKITTPHQRTPRPFQGPPLPGSSSKVLVHVALFGRTRGVGGGHGYDGAAFDGGLSAASRLEPQHFSHVAAFFYLCVRLLVHAHLRRRFFAVIGTSRLRMRKDDCECHIVGTGGPVVAQLLGTYITHSTYTLSKL